MIALFLNLLDTPEEKAKFTALYNQYKDLLYWVAFQKTHSVEDAEECVQETLFYVAKHFDKIGEVLSPRTKSYLCTIANGFAIKMFNRAHQTDTVSTDDEDADDPAFLEDFETTELAALISRTLDEESKTFLYLQYIYGYKGREIAEMYGVTDTYVRKKIQYAKEKLKKALTGDGENG